jgi:hypothetical protein
MFKGLKWVAAVIPLVAASFVMGAEGRGNQIVGTAHDFSNKVWAGQQICQPCHTPHHAMPNAVSGRLWNHDLTTATFTLNASNMNTIPGQPATMLDRMSQMCMGCHDGVTALDAFGGAHTSGNFATGRTNIGTDLSNDHPVGLFAIYEQDKMQGNHYSYKEESVVQAAGLRLQTVPIAYKRTTVDGQPANIEVPNAKVVSCNTCHNPHGAGIAYKVNGQAMMNKMLLRTPAETLCISCHTK